MLNLLFDYLLASGILFLVCLWLLFRPPPSPVPPPMPEPSEPPYRDMQPFRVPSIMRGGCRVYSHQGIGAALQAEKAGTAALLENALAGEPACWRTELTVSGQPRTAALYRN